MLLRQYFCDLRGMFQKPAWTLKLDFKWLPLITMFLLQIAVYKIIES